MISSTTSSDIDVTAFQISIDELLSSARRGGADETLEKMKAVVHNVQQIAGVDSANDYTGILSPTTSPNPQSPQLNGNPPTPAALKSRITRNAKGLITATRNFVSSNGLSPISLVDAAAANLTAAVVDYLKTVGIKATSENDLGHGQDIGEEDYETLAPRTHDPLNPVKAANALNKALDERTTRLNVLLQVNTSGEDSKSGLPPLPPPSGLDDTSSTDSELFQLHFQAVTFNANHVQLFLSVL